MPCITLQLLEFSATGQQINFRFCVVHPLILTAWSWFRSDMLWSQLLRCVGSAVFFPPERGYPVIASAALAAKVAASERQACKSETIKRTKLHYLQRATKRCYMHFRFPISYCHIHWMGVSTFPTCAVIGKYMHKFWEKGRTYADRMHKLCR